MSGVVLLRVGRVDGAGGHPRHLHPALDLKVLEAGLNRDGGHGASLVDGWLVAGGPTAWVEQALAMAPQVAVVKGETWCLEESVACGQALRRAGVVTIAVGQQVSHAVRSPVPGWPDAFDLSLAGEPEEELLGLLPRLLRGQLPNLEQYHQYFAEGHHFMVSAPDDLPRPAYSMNELQAFAFPFPLPGTPLRRWAYVLSASGCPHRCRHCSTVVRKSHGGRLRKRSPARVADEVAAHLSAGAEAIAFEDDTFLVDRRHFLAICEQLVRRNICAPWIANGRPDELDAERVGAAAATGAKLFKVGIETASARLIEGMGKTSDGAAWRRQAEQGLQRLRSCGIASVGLFLIGLPSETPDEVEDTLRWAQILAPDYAQVQVFRSYPDIPWWHDLAPEARDSGGAYHYGPVLKTSAAMSPAEVSSLQRDFYRRFYLRPGFVLRHVARYWQHYLHPAGLAGGLGRLNYIFGRAS